MLFLPELYSQRQRKWKWFSCDAIWYCDLSKTNKKRITKYLHSILLCEVDETWSGFSLARRYFSWQHFTLLILFDFDGSAKMWENVRCKLTLQNAAKWQWKNVIRNSNNELSIIEHSVYFETLLWWHPFGWMRYLWFTIAFRWTKPNQTILPYVTYIISCRNVLMAMTVPLLHSSVTVTRHTKIN